MLRTKQFKISPGAFTRLELMVVLSGIVLLSLIALPMLGRSHSTGSEAVCMNNLRNLSRAMLIYSEQGRGYVPQEGNIGRTIYDPANADAWYNRAVQPEYPAMTNLYSASAYPLPGNGTVYSCPAATLALALPSKAFAFFMYGENNFMCVNGGTIMALGQSVQSKFSTMPRPSVTIMMGEVAYAGTLQPALSGVTPNYTAAPHDGFGLFAMCDGSVAGFTTNQSIHIGAAQSAAAEWYNDGTSPSSGLTSWPCYWWPSATTPQ